MSDYLQSIIAVGIAADNLTRACARRGALVDSSAEEKPLTAQFKQVFRVSHFNPFDMTAALRKMP